MIDSLFDPVVLFFLAGMLAGIFKSDLKTPEALYETLSIFLLISIGLKGGVELSESSLAEVLLPSLTTLFIGIIIPLIAYFILRIIGKFNIYDSAALAAHYGSVSAVTFAVVISFLTSLNIQVEGIVTVLLVILEVPAISVGIMLAKRKDKSSGMKMSKLFHEVFLGKSIYLLLTGLIIGLIAGSEKITVLSPLFFDLFKGALALFLLEMGLLASKRLTELRSAGLFLIMFGIIMPLISAIIGSLAGYISGLSLGGSIVLATLAASASYIAAPAAVRIAIPKANPTYYLTASLAITFPFNVVFGIPIYYWFNSILFNF